MNFQIKAFLKRLVPTTQEFIQFLWISFFLAAVLCILEITTYSTVVKSFIQFPSPTFNSNFPELDVKFQRLNNPQVYDCMFFGSSMIDAGLNPVLFENSIRDLTGNEYTCFNMGLSGSMVESTYSISDAFSQTYPLELAVIGVSPIEMDRDFTVTRGASRIPIFTYMQRLPTIAGWLYGRTNLPWFLSALYHRRNSGYQSEIEFFQNALDERGGRVSTKVIEINHTIEEIKLAGFSINPVDLESLDKMVTTLTDRGVKVIVVEMPVHPRFFPFLIEGGEFFYEKEFLDPVRTHMKSHGIPFLETQALIEDSFLDDEWANRNHFNAKGRDHFTAIIIDQMVGSGLAGSWR